MAEPLRPDGEVFVEDVVIRTPGLTGMVDVYRPTNPGMRGEELTTEEFHQALGDASLAEQLSVVISQHQELTPADGTRGSGGADDIEVEVPAQGDDNAQVLLYAAEDGSRGTSPSMCRRPKRPSVGKSGGRTGSPRRSSPATSRTLARTAASSERSV
jgi:hypothetical protein